MEHLDGMKKRQNSLERSKAKGALCGKDWKQEEGQKWSEIAAAIITHAEFAVMPRNQRSVPVQKAPQRFQCQNAEV